MQHTHHMHKDLHSINCKYVKQSLMYQFLIDLLMQIQKGKVKHPIFDLHICNFILSK